MPIYSMTGFARTQFSVPLPNNGQLNCMLSLKSVNHRFLDVQLRLPSGLDALEMATSILPSRLIAAAKPPPATTMIWWPVSSPPLPRRATNTASPASQT
jgi:hypothetical protein